MKGKNSRVPAAHPYPNIPKVPSPVWLLPRFGSFLFPQSLDPPLFFLLWRPGLRDKWTPYYGIKQPVIKVPKFIVEKNNIIL